MADIEVKMGDLKITRNPGNLVAPGIGSCLAITLYDPRLKVGALAHSMLARHRPGSDNHSAKYVDTAIDEMLKRMKILGGRKEDIECKLIGGANMFTNIKSDIGKENVISAKKKLKENGIKLVGESVGGSVGKSVEFSVVTGIVTVKIKF